MPSALGLQRVRCNLGGLRHVAFVIDAYACRNRALACLTDSSLRPATGGRPGEGNGALHERSDRRFHLVIVAPHQALRRPLESAQYVSIKYTERLVEAGVEPSVGSVGDSYDNALAETINGLYKAEIIHRRGPWRSLEAVEFATLEWVELVQQPAALGAHRQHPAGRSRGTLLRHAGTTCHGGVTQTKWPPANPGRFTVPSQPVARQQRATHVGD